MMLWEIMVITGAAVGIPTLLFFWWLEWWWVRNNTPAQQRSDQFKKDYIDNRRRRT